MAQLNQTLQEYRTKDGSATYHLVRVAGFIGSENHQEFYQFLMNIPPEVRCLAIDLSRVEYINSSGIGALLALADRFKDREGELGLVNLPKNVEQPLSVLGATQAIKVYKDINSFLKVCRDLMKKAQPGGGAQPAAASPAPSATAPPPPAAAKPERKVSAADALAKQAEKLQINKVPVFLVVPDKNIFVDMLVFHISQRADCHMYLGCEEAKKSIDEQSPKLIVIEDRTDADDEFLAELKLNPKWAGIPVIKIYNRGPEPGTRRSFKIWETDSIVEPFDVQELFGLIGAELLRTASPNGIQQALHLTLYWSEANKKRAEKMGMAVIGTCPVTEGDRIKVEAAYREALDNAFRHGTHRDPTKPVDVQFLVTKEMLTIRVRDSGDGFDHKYFRHLAETMDTVQRAKLAHSQNKIGGLGIKLMMGCVSRVRYEKNGREVILEKDFEGNGAG